MFDEVCIAIYLQKMHNVYEYFTVERAKCNFRYKTKHMVNRSLRSVTQAIENYCQQNDSAYHLRFVKVVIPAVLLRPR